MPTTAALEASRVASALKKGYSGRKYTVDKYLRLVSGHEIAGRIHRRPSMKLEVGKRRVDVAHRVRHQPAEFTAIPADQPRQVLNSAGRIAGGFGKLRIFLQWVMKPFADYVGWNWLCLSGFGLPLLDVCLVFS